MSDVCCNHNTDNHNYLCASTTITKSFPTIHNDIVPTTNKADTITMMMMIPDLLRNLFDIDNLLCPTASTTRTVTTTSAAVNTNTDPDENTRLEVTPQVPLSNLTLDNVVADVVAIATTVPSPVIISPTITIKSIIDSTLTTTMDTTTTDTEEEEDDCDNDYETTELNRTTPSKPSNTATPMTTAKMMNVIPFPKIKHSTPSHLKTPGPPPPPPPPPPPVVASVRSHTKNGKRRNMASRFVVWPFPMPAKNHRNKSKSLSTVSPSQPPRCGEVVKMTRPLFRHDQRRRTTMTLYPELHDTSETTTIDVVVVSGGSTIRPISMLDNTERTEDSTATTSEHDYPTNNNNTSTISQLRQQLQNMDQQLYNMALLDDPHRINITSPCPNNDSNDTHMGIIWDQQLQSMQHLLARIQQDVAGMIMMNPTTPITTKNVDAVLASIERDVPFASTLSTTPALPKQMMVHNHVPASHNAATSSKHWNSFYIRLQDLDMEYCLPLDVSISSSLSSLSTMSTSFHNKSSSSSSRLYENKLYFHVTSSMKVGRILDRLVQYGYRTAIDPNDKNINGVDHIDFQPTRETQRLLQHSNKLGTSFFYDEWNANHVYTWIGTKDKNPTSNLATSDRFGDTWPITKVRAMIPNTTPLELISFLFDSSQVPKYNSISLGREDIMVWHHDQPDVNDTALSTIHHQHLMGTVKIVRGRVQPKLFPKVIETLCIMYITKIKEEPDSYMIVSRSIMEDESWENHDTTTTMPNSILTTTIRSEMLLNVYHVRPIKGHHHQYHPDHLKQPSGSGCTLTMVTHVVSTGVPEIIAKRMAPMTATNMVRDIQRIFSTKTPTTTTTNTTDFPVVSP